MNAAQKTHQGPLTKREIEEIKSLVVLAFNDSAYYAHTIWEDLINTIFNTEIKKQGKQKAKEPNVRARETKPARFSKPPTGGEDWDVLRMRRKIKNLSPFDRALLLNFYGKDNMRLSLQKWLRLWFFEEYEPNLKGCRLETRAIVHRMIEELITDHSNPKLHVKPYLNYGLDAKEWSRNYRHHWDALTQMIGDEHRRSLESLA